MVTVGGIHRPVGSRARFTCQTATAKSLALNDLSWPISFAGGPPNYTHPGFFGDNYNSIWWPAQSGVLTPSTANTPGELARFAGSFFVFVDSSDHPPPPDPVTPVAILFEARVYATTVSMVLTWPFGGFWNPVPFSLSVPRAGRYSFTGLPQASNSLGQIIGTTGLVTIQRPGGSRLLKITGIH